MTSTGNTLKSYFSVYRGSRAVSEGVLSRAFLNDAIHNTRDEYLGGWDDTGISPWDKLHQQPYNDAAREMWSDW